MIPHPESGIVQLVVMLLIAIVVVSFLGIDLQQAFATPVLVKNLQFVWGLVVYGWTTYIYTPITNFMGKAENNVAPESVPTFDAGTNAIGGSILK